MEGFGKSASPGKSQDKPSWIVCLSRVQEAFRVETGSCVKLKASWQILPQPGRLLSLLSDPPGKCPSYPEQSGMEGGGNGEMVQCSCSHWVGKNTKVTVPGEKQHTAIK